MGKRASFSLAGSALLDILSLLDLLMALNSSATGDPKSGLPRTVMPTGSKPPAQDTHTCFLAQHKSFLHVFKKESIRKLFSSFFFFLFLKIQLILFVRILEKYSDGAELY